MFDAFHTTCSLWLMQTILKLLNFSMAKRERSQPAANINLALPLKGNKFSSREWSLTHSPTDNYKSFARFQRFKSAA
jgi:hypothetical protein